MISALRLRPGRQALFLLLAALIYLVDSQAVRLAIDPARRLRIAAGASVDLVLVVGLLYYWLLVRPGLRPRTGLIFVAVIGLLRASFLFPEGMLVKAALAGCAEAGLIAFVAVQISRSRKQASDSGDPLVTIRNAVAAVIPFPAGARAITTEFSLVFYAMFGWRAQPHVPAGMHAFWLRESSDKAFLLATAALASIFEIVPVHLLVHRWSALAAWILTGISLYGMLWLLGLSRALVLRPALIGPETLDIRYGLIAHMHVRRSEIAGVERVTSASPGVLVLPRGAAPNLEISFHQPVTLERLFGSKNVSRIALCMENEGEFAAALVGGASRQNHDQWT